MKISELSRRSGVPLPTIKFYIREGLLEPGARTAHNQASYSEAHLERLELVRALRDDAGMSLGAIVRVLTSIRGAGSEAISAGVSALDRHEPEPVDEQSPEYRTAFDTVLRAAAATGWRVAAQQPAAHDVARSLVRIRRAFPDIAEHELTAYAKIADDLARIEIPDDWDPMASPGASLKYALLGTYLFEPLILAMRRLAHAERSTGLIAARAAPPEAAPGKPARRRSKRARRTRR